VCSSELAPTVHTTQETLVVQPIGAGSAPTSPAVSICQEIVRVNSQRGKGLPLPSEASVGILHEALHARLGPRVAVLITGSNLFNSGKDGGKYLEPLVKACASRFANNAELASRVVLVGSQAHGGTSGEAAWDNCMQETFFELASQGGGVPMLKLMFEEAAVVKVQLENGDTNDSLVTAHISTPDCTMEIKQGWKAAAAPCGLCFGGGPRAKSLVQKRDGMQTCSDFKDGAVPVPAAGGAHWASLVTGDCCTWKPAALSQEQWDALKAVKEGDLDTQDKVDLHADLLLAALCTIVDHEIRATKGIAD